MVTPLFVEPLDVALPAAHPLASADRIDPVALRGQTWICTHEGFPLTGVLQAIAALSGEPPIIGHRVNESSSRRRSSAPERRSPSCRGSRRAPW